MSNTLRLWVVARMTSNHEWIIGKERLGGTPVTDDSSPFYNRVPVSPIFCAQLEVIAYSTLLRPLQHQVGHGLKSLFASNSRKNWLTVYLTIFVLLHSCSLLTRRDEEYARTVGKPVS